MKRSSTIQRLLITTLVACTGMAAMSATAHADHGHGAVRYKGMNRVWRPEQMQRGPVVIRESSAGPALAGLVGGFLLGQAFGQPHVQRVVVRDCPPPPRYRYYDPYSDEYYTSLDDCPIGYRGRRHPAFVQVIEISSGRTVGAMQWIGGDWRSCDDRDFGRDHGNRWSGRDDDEDDGR